MSDQDVSTSTPTPTSTPEVDEDLSPEEALKAKLKEAIAVSVEDLGALRKKMTITVPRESIDEQLCEQYDELRHEAQVPGFRRGRAPQKLIEKRFGSEVGEKVGSSLIGASYLAAIDKESLDVLGDPLLYVTVPETREEGPGKQASVEVEKLLPVDQAIDHLDLPKEGEFSFSCEVELKPEFELPNLEKIAVERPKLNIQDEDIDQEIKRMLAFRGTFRPVEGGEVETDDIVVGTAKVIVDGETIKTEDNAELAARDQGYDGMVLEGFGEAVVGKKAGDTVSIEIDVPDDHDEVAVRGKKATFEMTILDIKRLDIPELDDAFIEQIGFESKDEYRDFVKDRMEERLEREIKSLMHSQVSQYLLDNTKMEVPDKTSQRQAERIVARKTMEMYRSGMPESEIAKYADEMRSQANEQAVSDLKHFFIMEKIADEKEVEISEEEINTSIAEIAAMRGQRFDRVRDEIISSNNLSTLYVRLRDEKILEMLLSDADVTEKDVKKEEGASDKPKAKAETKAKEETEKSTDA